MVSRSSLTHQKQIQWAKEREDLKNYGGLWGGIWNTQEKRFKPSIRSGQFKSSVDLQIFREEDPAPKRRTPSLPPINSSYEEEAGGEDTSGYASDSAGPEYQNAGEGWPKSPAAWPLPHFPRRTPDSISSGSGREERAKWGDRGVGVGHLWEPSVTLPPPPLPKIQPATPSWIRRGLQEPPQVLVISHEDGMSGTPGSSQGTTRSCDTPLSSEGSQRSYIRGQNVPLDPTELEERERKRQMAMDHQNAIKKQVEEKERQRRLEAERQEREERLAEERLKRQQELERQRLDEERRRIREKTEKDERIAKAMKEALEAAERTAREEKARARRKHYRESVSTPTSEHLQLPIVPPVIQVHRAEVERQSQTPTREVTPLVGRESSPAELKKKKLKEAITAAVLVAASEEKPEPGTPARSSPRVLATPQTKPELAVQPPATNPVHRSPYREERGSSEDSERPEQEELELSVRLEQLEIEAHNLRVIAEPGRVLTPSKYRASRAVERSTQTEIAQHSRTKVGKRYLRLDERPKWGVNKPTNQYIKASDRDPYRRRSRTRTSPRDSSSRSPSPLEDSKASFKSVGSLGKSNATYTLSGISKGGRVTRGVCTPRVMQVVPSGIIRKSSAGRRIISIKGSIGLNGRRINRPQQNNILPKKLEVSEFLTVNQVLTQLMDLKQGTTEDELLSSKALWESIGNTL